MQHVKTRRVASTCATHSQIERVASRTQAKKRSHAEVKLSCAALRRRSAFTLGDSRARARARARSPCLSVALTRARTRSSPAMRSLDRRRSLPADCRRSMPPLRFCGDDGGEEATGADDARTCQAPRVEARVVFVERAHERLQSFGSSPTFHAIACT